MSITDIGKKIKSRYTEQILPLLSQIRAGFDLKEDTFIILAIILIGLAGFGLGRLSALEKKRESVQIQPADFTAKSVTALVNPAATTTATTKGFVVASKSGQKYHFPWCAGASQIAEKNKIWFASFAEAQKAGYTPATNCPGLK